MGVLGIAATAVIAMIGYNERQLSELRQTLREERNEARNEVRTEMRALEAKIDAEVAQERERSREIEKGLHDRLTSQATGIEELLRLYRQIEAQRLQSERRYRNDDEP